MKQTRCVTVAGLTLFLFTSLQLRAGEAANESAKQDELARLQGSWQLLYAETNGAATPAKTVRSVRVEIKGNRHSVYVGDKPVAHDVSFDIDPTVTPKTTDDTINEGEDKGKQIHGIYQLDGDTLVSCVAKVGNDRPKEFAGEEGSGHTLRVFMKVKPDVDGRAKAVRDELIRFGGTWRFALLEMEGTEIPEKSLESSRLVIQGNRFLSKSPNGVVPGIFKIDPTVTPKTIDVYFTDPALKDKGHVGIYELTDDTYKVSLGMPGKPRPTSFTSKPGSGNGFEILKRVDKKAPTP